MNFKEHFSGGTAASAFAGVGAFALTGNIKHAAIVFACTLGGSLFPDLDTKSKPTMIVAGVLFVWLGCAMWVKEIDQTLPTILMWIFTGIQALNHRGLTHKYTFVLVWIVLGLAFKSLFMLGFSIGLITHYIIDSMSPLVWKHWRIFKLR